MHKSYKKTGDCVHDYLLEFGFEPKEFRDPVDKLNLVCRLNKAEHRLNLSKKKAKEVLKRIKPAIYSGTISKEIIIESMLYVLTCKKEPNYENIAFVRSKGFYNSSKWKNLRMKAISAYGNRCQACGASPKHDENVVIHIDHILPKSIYPEYGLSLSNLQVLCSDCNIGKGNTITNSFK